MIEIERHGCFYIFAAFPYLTKRTTGGRMEYSVIGTLNWTGVKRIANGYIITFLDCHYIYNTDYSVQGSV